MTNYDPKQNYKIITKINKNFTQYIKFVSLFVDPSNIIQPRNLKCFFLITTLILAVVYPFRKQIKRKPN